MHMNSSISLISPLITAFRKYSHPNMKYIFYKQPSRVRSGNVLLKMAARCPLTLLAVNFRGFLWAIDEPSPTPVEQCRLTAARYSEQWVREGRGGSAAQPNVGADVWTGSQLIQTWLSHDHVSDTYYTRFLPRLMTPYWSATSVTYVSGATQKSLDV